MKKHIIKKAASATLAIGLFSAVGSETHVLANDEGANTMEIATSKSTEKIDTNTFLSNKALSYPKSIDEYKRMGYKNITYSAWTQQNISNGSQGKTVINSRNILATAPYGLEVLIGQESYYYYQQGNKITSQNHSLNLLPV